ncbi:hypothetical protein AVEN_223652-1 [Araneus ventricosus]|uniref:Uncharacterized protein n=1 Tax=Araneus ventricosus TaxID=182803 RepID=A0A4Y2JE00_ARAVE|nr:hypothetical protein AVEN_223652-1 [Araneus ventricosus]
MTLCQISAPRAEGHDFENRAYEIAAKIVGVSYSKATRALTGESRDNHNILTPPSHEFSCAVAHRLLILEDGDTDNNIVSD